jgi:hypothetical protein
MFALSEKDALDYIYRLQKSGNQQWGEQKKTLSRPIDSVTKTYEKNGSFQNQYKRDMLL